MLDVAAYLIYIITLIYAAAIDWRTLRISNHVVVAIMLEWLVWQIVRDIAARFGYAGMPEAVSAASGVLAAVAFGAVLTLFVVVYEAITHRYSMGGGDVKLMAVSALFLGLQRSFFALMIACVSAVAIAPIYKRFRKRRRLSKASDAVSDEAHKNRAEDESAHDESEMTGIPFGPAIAVGSVVALFIYKI